MVMTIKGTAQRESEERREGGERKHVCMMGLRPL